MSESYYKNFIQTLSDHFMADLASIRAEYNFDYGDEFELAVCGVLDRILPDQYGVARGHIVDMNNESAGDDIIIFEKSRFPTLGLRGKGDFSRKEYIPSEAAYCYIEAKHTVVLKGDGGQSLLKACNQVGAAKSVMSSRPPRDGNQLSRYANISPGVGITVSMPPEYPGITNPPFGVVLARQVRLEAGSDILADPEEVEVGLGGFEVGGDQLMPDLMVLGNDVVILPALEYGKTRSIRSPFHLPNQSMPTVVKAPGRSFGIALASIMAALDWIELGVMPWHKIIVDGLGLPYE